MIYKIKHFLRTVINIFFGNGIDQIAGKYMRSFKKYAFVDCSCKHKAQFEASIIRLYHTLEKGMAYDDYRPGFGKDNVNKLILSLEQYEAKGYDVNEFFYETALSCLHKYISKNEEYGLIDEDLKNRVNKLAGSPNECGGTLKVYPTVDADKMNYEQLMEQRHSIRHFSAEEVDIELVKDAIRIAQYTPSACNRQCWRTRIIADKNMIKAVLSNQGGNRGFGQEINKLLLITADLRAQQRNREVFEAFIDGGMYAESVLNALFYKGLGSVPLSAALTNTQAKNIRELLNIPEAEILIMLIGVGNYSKEATTTTLSSRKNAYIEVI
jgi:nitroreductase